MENLANRIISTNDFFPAVREALKRGQNVKFTVSGYSMLPWITHNRDQVLLAGMNNRRPKPGDIILFQQKNGKYILHRIYKKELEIYRTIGDACIYEDEPVRLADMIGIVEKIYRKGNVIDCSSLYWRSIFWLWRKLLPIRSPLLKLYQFLCSIKGRFNK